jgi:hypothetical protein
LTDGDLEVLRRILRSFAETGRAPGDVDPETLQRLHDAHRLVLERGPATRVRMAHPFSGVATDVRVEAGNRSWYANCAWDGLGILAALDCDGLVATHCADCGEAIGLVVCDGRLEPSECVVHFVVPAAQWWDDIVYT